MEFREKTPCRRTNASAYDPQRRAELREDFHQRCGYCNDHDCFKDTFYEIDHFVPKSVLSTILPNDYSNFVYACRSCNNSKRDKWPTNNEKIHNDGKVGFLDPCSEEYSKQFIRLDNGSIHPVTDLGRWMSDALNLSNPRHRIVRMMEIISHNINILKERAQADQKHSEDLLKLYMQYYEYDKQLRNIPTL